jgi:hypothetical protein
MATIKSYTDLEQSKKLAEILTRESADMEYLAIKENGALIGIVPFVKDDTEVEDSAYSHIYDRIACWSLAALLNVLSEIKPQVYTPILFPSEGKWILQFAEYGHGNVCEVTCDNPVDACVAMIELLHELKML